ncbi:hypothetical protein Cylst_4557 [Cylindrospermum stagnale PCC 7417]|uniref:eCIS core domain-containing protein n=1 Tax=Cylindrospermum stagnale PCC 7417 TaxID=56107 RepID=K9X1Y4_9NOST|nr:DUF4157 domain-containing protein [Cylindrospermum stagnale]AFZ26635.1 hypothetical protein Cylst_4557 [Cylindrospermum stagnale PCC 7417]
MSRHKVQKSSFGNNAAPKKSSSLNPANSWTNPYQQRNAQSAEQPINTVKPPTTAEWLQDNVFLKAIETRKAQLQRQQLEENAGTEPQIESIQTKLTVGEPGDKYEQEADMMASRVMSMPDNAVQRLLKPEEQTEQEIQTKPLANAITPLVQRAAMPVSDGSSQANGNIETRLNSTKGGGSPLSADVRGFMEPRFGADFSQVRVHTGSEAVQMNRELGAQAFAHGSNIYFGASKAPGNNELTAHELTHVVQQTGAKTLQQKPVTEPKTLVLQAMMIRWTIQRRVPQQSASKDGTFAIRSTAGSTVKVGTQITYSIVPTNPTPIASGSSYHYQWSIENDHNTYATYVKTNPGLRQTLESPIDAQKWSLRAAFPGTHRIKGKVLFNDRPVSNLVFQQTVTDDGRSLLHKNLMQAANQANVDKDVKEWTTLDLIKWKFPKLGEPNYIHDFKKQWVRGYRQVIKSAATQFNLPEVLVGGVAYNEVGGDPLWIDDIAHAIRTFDHSADPLLEPLTINKKPELTSFGNLSTQVRRAAETLGYEPEKLSNEQERMIIDSLKDPKQGIFIAVGHLAELRDIDFPGKGAAQMTLDDIKVTATRYNRGSHLSIEQIKRNLIYGEAIINKYQQLIALLND